MLYHALPEIRGVRRSSGGDYVTGEALTIFTEICQVSHVPCSSQAKPAYPHPYTCHYVYLWVGLFSALRILFRMSLGLQFRDMPESGNADSEFCYSANFFSVLLFWPTQAFNVYGQDPIGVGIRGLPIGFGILAGAFIVLWLLSVLRGHNRELMIASSVMMTAGK